MSLLSRLNREVGCVLPHTLPKQVHVDYIERCVSPVLAQYRALSEQEINQNQALQLLFDVKFVMTFSVQRENAELVAQSQSICDRLRSKIDPFDLDVFYSHLQMNVKRAVTQSQVSTDDSLFRSQISTGYIRRLSPPMTDHQWSD